jgi:hypothetical protein
VNGIRLETELPMEHLFESSINGLSADERWTKDENKGANRY